MRGDAYLISYTKINTFAISFILTVLVFGIFEFCYVEVQGIYFDIRDSKIIHENKVEKIGISETKEKGVKSKQYIENNDINENIWQIEIPKIDLIAPISEGTSQEIMLEYVGHFENTQKWKGNVGLAAHNRGYPINYFSRIKELEINDEIIYKTIYGVKKYKINLSTVIEETNWNYLKETEENKITLITCVENQPTKRRCIQAIEIEEE